MAALGELPLETGSITMPSRVAYAAQEPWLLSGTLVENVVCGEPWDRSRFDRVVRACALERDLQALAHGEQTRVGERGETLSGGQKARVSLARACYKQGVEVYLLDDVLSAVDPRTARHIMEECLCGLLAGTTRLLVTHQELPLSVADVVIVLDGGAVVEDTHSRSVLGLVVADTEKGSMEVEESAKSTEVPEDSSNGQVTWRTYLAWGEAGGWLAWTLALFMLLAAQVLVILASWWLQHWAKQSIEEQQDAQYLHILAALTAGAVVLSLGRSCFLYAMMVNAAQRLHHKMTHAVLRSPMAFFDVNPSGRILNRFSKDCGFIDEMLPQTFLDFVASAGMVLGTIGFACAVNPIVLAAVLPLLLVFLRSRGFYLASARQIKRIEAITRSPIFTALEETIQGLATVRALGRSDHFRGAFERGVDANSAAYFWFLASSRWFAVRLEAFNILFLAAIIFASLALLSFSPDAIPRGMIGLAITFSLQLAGVWQWVVRQSAEVENQMVSVERVAAYAALPSEAPLSIPSTQPDASWPAKGEIVVRDLVVRYRPELPPVLNSLSMHIPGGSRAAIVGRTGAGKSTVLQAMLRLVEAESGSVSVDGIDLAQLGLHAARRCVAAIPQVPILFAGSLRSNLDSFGEWGDAEVWNALAQAQMKGVVDSWQDGLEQPIAAGGGNLSTGQKQLMCLARAILMRSRVLVLDEPTANVDAQTDAALQRAVREAFASNTIVMIAHRLGTVLDCDLLFVLDQGRCVESGAPRALMQVPGGYFRGMAADAGLVEDPSQGATRVCARAC